MQTKSICLAFLMLTFLSCGGEEQPSNSNIVNKTNNLDENSAIGPIDQNIKFYMTFDILGGMFRKDEEPSNAITLAKGLVTTHPSGETPEETGPFPSEPFQIDASKNYRGLNGEGLLTLSMLGEGEEIFPSHDPQNIIRHFSALTLRFVFHDYAFNNPCLGKVKLKGELHCEIQGDYEMKPKTFLGEAHCVDGPKENPKPILYRVPQKDFAVEVDSVLIIDGDPYRYRSYDYDGEIAIDGEKLPIKDLIHQGSSCKNE